MAVEDSKVQVQVGPVAVGPESFFGTSSAILGAMAVDKGYELFHMLYPFWNISGQELERVVVEQMGDGPESEQKSGCLAKVACLTEVPYVELDIPVSGCLPSDIKIDMPEVELGTPISGCSPCLFMAVKGQGASNDVAGNKDNSNGTREEREELQMVTSL
ncbi:hypothetical protein ACGP04_11265 [Piscirickettsia salmonis]